MATIKDVAARAGVSISTVSNVLSKSRYVSPETAERVHRAVDELSFSLNIAARNMRAKRSMMIGVVLPSVSRLFYAQVMSGMGEMAGKAGYSSALYVTDYDIKRERKAIHNLLQNKVDGIVLSSVVDESDAEYFRSLVDLRYGDKKVHVVSICRDLTAFGISSITWDNKESAKSATQAMIARGAKRIMCMTSYSAGSSLQRLEGYKEALAENNIPFDPTLCIQERGYAWTGYSVTMRLLNDAVAFDGIFAGNDQRAIGAIKAINERGLKVPDNIMVAGFENSFVSSLIQPSLTTVNVPKRRLGREAISLLMKLQEEDDGMRSEKPKIILMPTQLVERSSTNCDIQTAWELEDW